VKELIQNELTPGNLRRELDALLTNETTQQQLQNDYADLRKLLGQGGHASARAAQVIKEFMATTSSSPTSR
jgi:lipid-A-disaccharide synthase